MAGGIGQSQDGGPGHVTFYVSTDDPQATLDKAESLGGKTIMPITELPQVTMPCSPTRRDTKRRLLARSATAFLATT